MNVKNLHELQTLLYQLIAGPGALNGDAEHGQLFPNVGLIIRDDLRLQAFERSTFMRTAISTACSNA